uniref:Somatostatin n=1 Tax=Athene cunicularia TaxID=194338 RepID=A0A663N0R2_ATHCN
SKAPGTPVAYPPLPCCRPLQFPTGYPSTLRADQFLTGPPQCPPFRPPELAKYFLAELLSEPSQTENEALESEDLSRGAEQDEVRLELERSANSNPALAPRERKAGCKNFFWKTFTSC